MVVYSIAKWRHTLHEAIEESNNQHRNGMKRVKLKHGSARVDDNCPKETIDALNKLSEKVHNTSKEEIEKILSRMDDCTDFNDPLDGPIKL